MSACVGVFPAISQHSDDQTAAPGQIKTGDDVNRMHTYIISVDVPSHITVWDQLSIDVAADFTIPPAVVNVYNANHVPLQKPTEEKNDENQYCTFNCEMSQIHSSF